MQSAIIFNLVRTVFRMNCAFRVPSTVVQYLKVELDSLLNFYSLMNESLAIFRVTFHLWGEFVLSGIHHTCQMMVLWALVV